MVQSTSAWSAKSLGLLFSLQLKENFDFSSAETIASSFRDMRYAVPGLLKLTVELRNPFYPSW
jgi:hypothetical protein